ncbi:MAG: F0F1 ATP synthase subunit A [Thermoanaerobaculia bacterium]
MADLDPLEHIVQHPLITMEADLGPLTPNGEITLLSDHITMLLAAGVLLTIFLPILLRRRKVAGEVESLVPRGFGNMVEAICQYLREEMARPALGEHTDRFIKYIWSVFFFILTINMLGLLPISSVGRWAFGISIGGTATANIWVTSTMATISFLMIVGNGIRLGGKDFIAHLCPGPLWLAPILVPIEILGFFAKAFALAVRLFANMVAGHALLAVLLGFILNVGSDSGTLAGLAIAVPVVLGSVAISMLEIFVAFLQAFIFSFLTTLFIGLSISVHHEEPHEEAHI